ncbi:hypothetical protein DCC81_23925 [Chitinophaga parva]|uniref:GIY-YIG domain-containing protein n=1 Tax=Chitinophaga parva TaxID=2169414 RepID=A0A2T7BEH3_9BACT|nr:hypothetical protein [Chitinophaga parva]PUZ23430.1 hypothetical protein DCC81_23925 [Chitinophaga parva]
MLPKITFEIVTLKWQSLKYTEVGDACGVYQVYGTSPLYGIDTLLYIGRSINPKARLKDHFEFTEGALGRQPNKSCRFAEVAGELIEIVEATLIAMYKPSFNIAGLNNVEYKAKERAIYIQNHGERGMLNYENTNYYFLKPELQGKI